MPQLIEVPGHGEVEFPDDMDDDAIASSLKGIVTQPDQPGVGDDLANVWNAVKRGAYTAWESANARAINDAQGKMQFMQGVTGIEPDAAESARFQQEGIAPLFGNIASAEQAKAAIPATGGLSQFYNGENWFQAWAKNPIEVTSAIIAESLPSMAPGMAATAAAGPGLGALAAGLSSFNVEYSSGILDAFSKAGANLKDEASLSEFFSDPERVSAAKEYALKRGIPIAMFDAASAGFAGRMLKAAGGKGAAKILAATAGELGLQMAAGASGETVAQLASEGAITNTRSIFSEAIGEMLTAPTDIYGNLKGELTPQTALPQSPVAVAKIDTELTQSDAPITEASVDNALAEMLGIPLNATGTVTEPNNEQSQAQSVSEVPDAETDVQLPEPAVAADNPAASVTPDEIAPESPSVEPAVAAPEGDLPTGAEPVAVEAVPTESVAPSPDDYVPAIKVGGEIVRGQKGDTHQDVLNRYIDANPDAAAEALMDFDTKENPNFFLRGDEPVTRDQLKATLGTSDSQGLRKLQTKVETAAAPEIAPDGKAAATEPVPPTDYQGGPGAMGPVEAGEMQDAGKTTSLKKAVVKDERLARGLADLPASARESEEARVQKAEDIVDNNPAAAPNLVSRIVDTGEKKISADEAAILLVERTRLMNERTKWEESRGEEGASVEQRARAEAELAEIEKQTERLDLAQRAAGSEWGRTGRMYQQMMREDFTLESLERQARAEKGGPLSREEKAKLAEQAKEIQALQAKLEEETAKANEATLKAERTAILEATINDLRQQEAARPKYGQAVLDRAEKIVSKLEERAADASKRLRQRLGITSAGVDPTIVLDIAEIMAAKIGRLGLKFAEVARDLTAEFGNAIEPYLEEAWTRANKIIGQTTGGGTRKVVEDGVSKPKKAEKKPADVAARAKAEATAGLELSQKTAYEAVRAAINSGVKGEAEIMAAALSTLKPHFPDLTPGQLDIAFTEYGKAKFPSKEEDKRMLAKLRRLRQMQAAIDDVTKTGQTKKSGLQRERADEDVRRRQAELKAAIEQFGKEAPTSEEQLANLERARLSRAENAIKDLDRELRTGEAKLKSAPRPASPQVEQLQAELAAMRELKKEIEDAKNPPPTPEEKYNATRLKSLERQIADTEARIKAKDFAVRPKKVQPPKNTKVLDAEIALDKLKQEIAKGRYEMKMANRSPGRKILDGFQATRGAFVNILSSFDLSAPRQALFAILSNIGRLPNSPIQSAKMTGGSFKAMFRALRNEQTALRIEKAIQKRPNYVSGAYKLADVNFTELETKQFTKFEENAHSILDEWAKQDFGTGRPVRDALTAPQKTGARIVRISNRAFITFLNQTRADLFDELIHVGYPDRPPTVDELKLIGNYVNIATGRGKLSPTTAKVLSEALWAPRLLASRFQLLTGQPLWTGEWKDSSRARSIIAKEYARAIAGGFLLLAVSRLFDEKKEEDPRSSDFGKIVRGNTRVDVWGGLQQPVVFMSRGLTAERKSISGEVKDIGSERSFGVNGPAVMLLDFARSKLRPEVGAALNAFDRRDFVGREVGVKETLKALAPVPLPLRDVAKIIREHGWTEGLILQALSEFGAGVQNYSEENDTKPSR
jgi:hypothetical protein